MKTYTVDHTPTCGSIRIEVDIDFVNMSGKTEYTTKQAIKDMVDFWTGSEGRLDDNDGDYLNTFLKQLCSEAMRITGNRNLNAIGVIAEIEGKEGWCPMDGSFGIKLLNVCSPELDTQDDFEIEELQLA